MAKDELKRQKTAQEEIKKDVLDRDERAENKEENTHSQKEENNVQEKVEQEETAESKVDRLEKELEEQKKEYMFLVAEFDNYRKRTLKEKQDLIKTASGKAMEELLPVVDDMERALDMIGKSDDMESLKEGVSLIYNKFVKYLEKQHVVAMETDGVDFDSDFHDAVTMFPTPDESKKNKIIDTVLKGYMINDKVLRHAKVVVGQ